VLGGVLARSQVPLHRSFEDPLAILCALAFATAARAEAQASTVRVERCALLQKGHAILLLNAKFFPEGTSEPA
jgi:hypothetical protein